MLCVLSCCVLVCLRTKIISLRLHWQFYVSLRENTIYVARVPATFEIQLLPYQENLHSNALPLQPEWCSLVYNTDRSMTLFIDDLWVCVKCLGKIKITVMDSITTCFFNWLQVTPPEMILNPFSFIYSGHICFLCVWEVCLYNFKVVDITGLPPSSPYVHASGCII